MRKANLERLLARRPEGIFLSPFEQGEIGPDLFRKACEFGLDGPCLEASRPTLSERQVKALDQGEEPQASGLRPGQGSTIGSPRLLRYGCEWQRGTRTAETALPPKPDIKSRTVMSALGQRQKSDTDPLLNNLLTLGASPRHDRCVDGDAMTRQDWLLALRTFIVSI